MIDWDKPLQATDGSKAVLSKDFMRIARVSGRLYLFDEQGGLRGAIDRVFIPGFNLQNAPTGKTWAEERAGMERGEVWRLGSFDYKIIDDGLMYRAEVKNDWFDSSFSTGYLDATDWVKVE